jgi:uncharacterized membrane protein
MFYYNPNDPAVFVSPRVGIGCTMNLASKWAWVFLALVVAVVVALLVIVKSAT